MSTRCSIHIQQPDDTFKMYYHHCDGYMSGVGDALYSMPKARRTSVKSIMRALEKMFGRRYSLGKYPDVNDNDTTPIEIEINTSQLEVLVGKDPGDIEWRYRILKDGSLEVDAINTGETFKIANRRHFDNLVHSTEHDLND